MGTTTSSMPPSTHQQFRRMDAQLNQLLEQLKHLSHQQLNRKPNEESWSVMQVLHHLMLVERYAMLYLQKKLSYNPALKKAGLSASLRELALRAYLRSPLKFQAPESISGANLPAESSFWEIAKQWKLQRAELKSYLESLPPELYSKEVYKHPLAGRLSLKGMMSFFEDHFNRHLRQINRMLH